MLRFMPLVVIGVLLLRVAPVDMLCCVPSFAPHACIPVTPLAITAVNSGCCASEAPVPQPADDGCDMSCCLVADDQVVEPEWLPRTLTVVLPEPELLVMQAPLPAPALQLAQLTSGSDPPAPRALRPWMCQLL